MHTLSWHFNFFSSLWSASFVTGAAWSNILTPSAPADNNHLPHRTNLTLSAGSPTDFKAILQEQRGSKLPGELCLQTAIQVIGEYLALENFFGPIPAQAWSRSNLVISVSTQGVRGNSIERRCVIWGIFEALTQIVREEDFRSAIFRLEWHGVLVGSVAFHRGDVAGVDPQSNQTYMPQLVSPTLLNITGDNQSAVLTPYPLAVPKLELRLSRITPPQPLYLYGILMNLIGLLMQAAEQSEDIIKEPYTLSVGNYGVQISMGGGSSPVPPTTPPFLNYVSIIKAVTCIPALLDRLKISEAFRILLLLDKGTILVDYTRFMTASAPSDSLLQRSVDVSTG